MNEHLKREVHIRDKDIEKLNETIKKLEWKLAKAHLKLTKINDKFGKKIDVIIKDEEIRLANKRNSM